MTTYCEEQTAPLGVPDRVSCLVCGRGITAQTRYTSMKAADGAVVGNYCHHCMPESPCEVLCMNSVEKYVGVCVTCKARIPAGDLRVLSGIRAVWRYDHPPLSTYCTEHSPCAGAA